ncbi:hypothetical protein F2P81_012345 [Scophthalmus maximus]|uniref:Uncharacterized protein n=1 Tax=Scophthalmus maximus TaxID=52904 RepID=A0A6A4SN24_SCOMX|nr:hypothetical protein F2P81_012345 [Scophthalmus maximus]
MLFSAQPLFFVAWKHYYHSQCPHTHTHTHTTRHREPPHDSSDGKWKCGVRVLCESEYTLCRERPQECNTLNIVNIFFPLRSYGLTVLTQSTYSQGYIKPNTYCILCYNVMDMTTDDYQNWKPVVVSQTDFLGSLHSAVHSLWRSAFIPLVHTSAAQLTHSAATNSKKRKEAYLLVSGAVRVAVGIVMPFSQKSNTEEFAANQRTTRSDGSVCGGSFGDAALQPDSRSHQTSGSSVGPGIVP